MSNRQPDPRDYFNLEDLLLIQEALERLVRAVSATLSRENPPTADTRYKLERAGRLLDDIKSLIESRKYRT
jgi:hypothetical protein